MQTASWRTKGFAAAQFSLGMMYFSGKGVPQDDVEAANGIRMAAEQSDAESQVNLGYMYTAGQGVPENYVEGNRVS